MDNSPSPKAGTMQDKQDMWRAGQDQELNPEHQKESKMTNVAEKLPVSFRSWIYGSADVHMGSSSLGPVVWRSVSLGVRVRTRQLSGPIKLHHWLDLRVGLYTGIAGCCYTVANMMVGVISINYPDTYTYEDMACYTACYCGGPSSLDV
ncbi:CheY-like superfamily [Penicillium cf. griseofulvum]|nr:CheY-like superfamily [Penicillium cf. griseofulvum]